MFQVILIPHSHNDPGWLKTFEHYFHYESKQILNNMVAKLQQHPNLTFIWSEVSFLSAWWDSAHPSKQRALRKLVKEGRVEITTGGWVMTDEANSHVYAMVDQLIEGKTSSAFSIFKWIAILTNLFHFYLFQYLSLTSFFLSSSFLTQSLRLVVGLHDYFYLQ